MEKGNLSVPFAFLPELSPQEEQLTLTLLSVTADGWLILKCDASLTLHAYSESFSALLGQTPQTLSELLAPASAASLRTAVLAESPTRLDAEWTLTGASGHRLLLRVRGLPCGEGDERRFYLGFNDQTAQLRRQEAVNTQLEQYQLVADRLRSAVFLYDFETDTLCAYGDRSNLWKENSVVLCFLSSPVEGLSGRYLQYRAVLKRILLDSDDFENRPLLLPVSETEDRWKRISAISLRDDQDHRKRRLCFLEDMEDEMREREDLSRRAQRDQLTGLLNRRACEEQISADLRLAGEGHSFTMLFLDLDGFKRVNDLLGHTMGDQVLQKAAQIIRACFRGRDEVYRLGGDEFIVWMKNAIYRELVRKKARRLNRELRHMVAQMKVPSLSVSVGVAAALPGDSFEMLYRRADAAMYDAKRKGKGRCFFCDRENDGAEPAHTLHPLLETPEDQTMLPGFQDLSTTR